MSQTWTLEVLVISGGGVKGAGFLGSLLPLEDKYGNEFWKKTKYIAGSSIGGFIGTGLVIGYSVREMLDMFLDTNFSSLCSFFQDDHKKIKSIKNLFTDLGMDQGTKLFDYVTCILEKKIKPDITFKQLYDQTQQTLLMTSACLTDGKTGYFSWYHTPDVEVRKAVLMTMRLPLLYTPILHEEKLHIDGNFFDPFPIKALPKEARKIAKQGGLLGIISGKLEKSYKIENSFQVMTALLNHISSKYVELSCKRYRNSIIRLSMDIVNGTNLNVTKNDLEIIADWGKEMGTAYFEKRGYPTLR